MIHYFNNNANNILELFDEGLLTFDFFSGIVGILVSTLFRILIKSISLYLGSVVFGSSGGFACGSFGDFFCVSGCDGSSCWSSCVSSCLFRYYRFIIVFHGCKL